MDTIFSRFKTALMKQGISFISQKEHWSDDHKKIYDRMYDLDSVLTFLERIVVDTRCYSPILEIFSLPEDESCIASVFDEQIRETIATTIVNGCVARIAEHLFTISLMVMRTELFKSFVFSNNEKNQIRITTSVTQPDHESICVCVSVGQEFELSTAIDTSDLCTSLHVNFQQIDTHAVRSTTLTAKDLYGQFMSYQKT